MDQVKSRIPEIGSSIFSTMSTLASEYDAVDLSQGFPNFETSEELKKMVTKAMASGFNQYAPMPGIFALREAVSNKVYSLYNKRYNPETEITITAGATQALYTAITAFVLPGDEVIVFKPAYDSYEPSVKINGGIPVQVQMRGNDYTIDWDEIRSKISSKTKMIIINTPHNPSGRLFSKEDMMELEKIIVGTNIILLSDEVYEHLVFDGKEHQSAALFAQLAEHTLICASFGKTFHNTGWKIGYCIGPKRLMEAFRRIHQFQVFAVHHPSQVAFAEFLNNPSRYLELPEFYQKKRDFFISKISGSRFTFLPSEGTYFQVLDFSGISEESDVDFAKKLIKEHNLASIPMSVFNIDGQDNKKLRFCFAKTEDTLLKAARIICQI